MVTDVPDGSIITPPVVATTFWTVLSIAEPDVDGVGTAVGVDRAAGMADDVLEDPPPPPQAVSDKATSNTVAVKILFNSTLPMKSDSGKSTLTLNALQQGYHVNLIEQNTEHDH